MFAKEIQRTQRTAQKVIQAAVTEARNAVIKFMGIRSTEPAVMKKHKGKALIFILGKIMDRIGIESSDWRAETAW